MPAVILVTPPPMDLSPYSCDCCGSTDKCALLTIPVQESWSPAPQIIYRGLLSLSSGNYHSTSDPSILLLTPAGGGAWNVQAHNGGGAGPWTGVLPGTPGSCSLTNSSPPGGWPVSTMHLVVQDVAESSCCDLVTVDSCDQVPADMPGSVTVSMVDVGPLWASPVTCDRTVTFDNGTHCWTVQYADEFVVDTCTLTDPDGIRPPVTYELVRLTTASLVASTGVFNPWPTPLYAGSVRADVRFYTRVVASSEPFPMNLYTETHVGGYGSYTRGGIVFCRCPVTGLTFPVSGTGPYGLFPELLTGPTRTPTLSCSGGTTGALSGATGPITVTF